eukprot:7317409-Alexandrium_andersonii.AAC.1
MALSQQRLPGNLGMGTPRQRARSGLAGGSIQHEGGSVGFLSQPACRPSGDYEVSIRVVFLWGDPSGRWHNVAKP